ncbi:MAG: type III secretion system export apparatus subunit SctU [Vulcanimicrobiaceae bacterium]
MAEEKPFDASPTKLAKARRDGDVPRSADVNAVVSLACASLALFGGLDVAASAARQAFARAAIAAPATDVELLASRIDRGAYGTLAFVAIVLIVCALVGAVVATFAQTRSLAFKAPVPKPQKLDPIAGIKRMVSRDALVGGAKALVVACAVAGAAVPAALGIFAALGTGAAGELAALVLRSLRSMLVGALAVAGIFAAGDVVLERAKWRKRLKMSFDELRRDSKASDGDPLLRGRRRQAHRALVRGSTARVKDAAFVIANPTHVAIALEYRPPVVAVPRVLVRAIDAGALDVRRRARELGVPVVEHVALARALLAATDVGDFIPPDAYAPVAAIVAMLARAGKVA